jgi:hypothetical protein
MRMMDFSIKNIDTFGEPWKAQLRHREQTVSIKTADDLLHAQQSNRVIAVSATNVQINYRGKSLQIPVESISKIHLVKSRPGFFGKFSPFEIMMPKKYLLKTMLTNGKEISFRVAAKDRHLFLDVIAHVRNLRMSRKEKKLRIMNDLL